MIQVSESVHIIELKLPFHDTPVLNVYIIKGTKSSIVIDTGMGDATSDRFLTKGIDELGLRRRDVSFVVNTHEHIEHFSGNYSLVESTGALIVAHRIAREYIENPSRMVEGEDVIKSLPKEAGDQLRRWGSFFNLIRPTKVGRIVEDGDLLDQVDGKALRVIHTPGHARGHICLYDEDKKTLFSGDQVLGTGTPYVGRWGYDASGDMGDYLASLKRLKELDLNLILPSHGPLVTEPYKRIDETIERKLKREKSIIESIKGVDEKDIWTITKEVYDCPPSEVYFLASCVLAYLSKLRKEGKVEYFNRGFDVICRLKK
jgi:glyoxylase-like metal-dependent hydrolase (beta-lactamase superfamily II)